MIAEVKYTQNTQTTDMKWVTFDRRTMVSVVSLEFSVCWSNHYQISKSILCTYLPWTERWTTGWFVV